jgi:hypothetical protein
MATTMVPLAGTALLTTASTPTIGKFNRYNATSSSLSPTLPALSGLSVGARLAVQKYTLDVSSNTVTLTCAGSDKFDDGTTTSMTLSITGAQYEFQVVTISSIKRWKLVGSYIPNVSSGGIAVVTYTGSLSAARPTASAVYWVDFPSTPTNAQSQDIVASAGAIGSGGGVLQPVQAHTIGSETFTISSGNVTQISGTTIHDGTYSPPVGARLLIINAPAATGTGSYFGTTAQPGNGIYTVTSNATNLSLSRVSDMSGSVKPAGLMAFSESASLSWNKQTLWAVTTPSTAAAFTYGTGSIGFEVVGGRNPNFASITTANSTYTFNMWNGSNSTYLMPQSGPYSEINVPAAAIALLDAEQFITLTSAYTLGNNTSLQKLFNNPANGTVTLSANSTYFFECLFTLSSLSSSSHSVGFGFAGTAAITRQAWWSDAIAGAAATPGTVQRTFNTATNTTLVTAGTVTECNAVIRGKLVIGTGGTLIPQVQQTTAATGTAAVANDSYFRIWRVGANTIQSFGSWT